MEETYILPKGSTIKVEGIPLTLVEDTKVSTHPNNWKLIKGLQDSPSAMHPLDAFIISTGLDDATWDKGSCPPIE